MYHNPSHSTYYPLFRLSSVTGQREGPKYRNVKDKNEYVETDMRSGNVGQGKAEMRVLGVGSVRQGEVCLGWRS